MLTCRRMYHRHSRRNNSGYVDFSELCAWWHKDGSIRIRKPAARVRALLSSALATAAPRFVARWDAQKALITRARAAARAQVRRRSEQFAWWTSNPGVMPLGAVSGP